jgi:hypothetical protein
MMLLPSTIAARVVCLATDADATCKLNGAGIDASTVILF